MRIITTVKIIGWKEMEVILMWINLECFQEEGKETGGYIVECILEDTQ